MQIKKYVTLLSLPLFLMACSGNKSLPETTEAGTKPAFSVHNGDTDIAGDSQKLAIASYKVIFITGGSKKEVAADTGRWGSTGKTESSATIRTRLKNIDSQLMQNITDKAYENFRQSLESKGFEVLDMQQVASNKEFEDLKKRDNGGDFDELLKAHKTNVYDFPTFSPTGLPLIASSFFCKDGAISANLCLNKVAGNLGTTVVHVLQVVDFSSFDANSNVGKDYFTNKVYSEAKVSAGQNLHLLPGFTGLSLVNKKGKTLTLILDEDNPYQGPRAFGESVEATSTGDKVASGIGNALGFLSGISGGKARSNSTATYEIQAKPEVYEAMVGDMLAASGKELAWTLAQYRNK